MMELLVMWGIPVLFLLLSGQSPLFQNWRFLIALAFGFYLALGLSPLTLDMGKAWLPKELAAYSVAATLALSALIFAFALHRIMAGLSSHGNGGYHLPKQRNLLIQTFGFLSGYVFSALVGLVICTSPLSTRLGAGKEFSGRVVGRTCIVTGVIDGFSLQLSSTFKRKKRLNTLIDSVSKKLEKPAPVAPKVVKDETPVIQMQEQMPDTPAEGAAAQIPENTSAEQVGANTNKNQ